MAWHPDSTGVIERGMLAMGSDRNLGDPDVSMWKVGRGAARGNRPRPTGCGARRLVVLAEGSLRLSVSKKQLCVGNPSWHNGLEDLR